MLNHIVHSFFSTKLQDNYVLTENIYSHEQKHRYTTERCRSANDQSQPRNLLGYLNSDETKVRHLLMSLCSSMDNVVDTLQSKDSLTYLHIHSRILVSSGSSNLSSSGKALNTASH